MKGTLSTSVPLVNNPGALSKHARLRQTIEECPGAEFLKKQISRSPIAFQKLEGYVPAKLNHN